MVDEVLDADGPARVVAGADGRPLLRPARTRSKQYVIDGALKIRLKGTP